MKKRLWNLVVGLAVISGMIGGWFGGVIGDFPVAFAEEVVDDEDDETIDGETIDDKAVDRGEDDEKIADGEDDEAEWERPELFIKAINPGYKIENANNVGEMIEIARGESSDTPILLAGAAVGYTNSSGKFSILFEFPENSWMTGESILLRLASSPGSELANATYKKTLAINAKLEIILNGEVIDEVCFTGKTGCYEKFLTATPTTLVRDVKTGEFVHKSEYAPEFGRENYYLAVEEAEEEEVKTAQCAGLEFSEILSYYEADKAEQFIEFYNSGASEVKLDGCKIRYKNKDYVLAGTVAAEGYFVYYPEGFKLTKNPVNMNALELVDTDETVVDTLEYPNGQKKGAAYALIGHNESGAEIWATTYDPTPGEANNYQKFRTCTEGKVINEATGNCVKVVSLAEKVCPEGYYLNLLTGRCNKNKTTTEKTCKEGYYLNPETNRCRKIQENTGADYGIVAEEYEENSAFVAAIAIGGVAVAGVGYLIWEFREEIGKIWRKILKK